MSITTINDCIIWVELKGVNMGTYNNLYLCRCRNVPTCSRRHATIEQTIFDL